LSIVTTLLPLKNQIGDGAKPASRIGVGSKIGIRYWVLGIG
jgi:hypothetical protein